MIASLDRAAASESLSSTSPTVRRVLVAYQLLLSHDKKEKKKQSDNCDEEVNNREDECHELAQRVIQVSCSTESGSISGWTLDESTNERNYELILDNGERVHNISPSNITPIIDSNIVNNDRLDFVSRIIWVNALSENRIPLNGVHMDPELSPWTIFGPAFQLTTPWSTELCDSPPFLGSLQFEWWLYLLAEATRSMLKGSPYLALLIIEEAYKHLSTAELEYDQNCEDERARGFVEGVAELVTLYPSAVRALGKCETSPGVGNFTLLRHIVSTQAIKIVRAVYRKPKSERYTADEQLLLQRYKFFVDMQFAAENELRERKCSFIFGGGQALWNFGWLYSLGFSNYQTVYQYLHECILRADEDNSNDFLSAKARWDLAGCAMLGGGGPMFDLRDIRQYRDEAMQYEEKLAFIGMKFYVQGESMFGKLVTDHLRKVHKKASSMQPQLKPVKSSKTALVVCHSCLGRGDGLKACSACKGVKYCSRECQKKDFKVHKKVCKKINS